jgi:large subunit ribosomal protein L15
MHFLQFFLTRTFFFLFFSPSRFAFRFFFDFGLNIDAYSAFVPRTHKLYIAPPTTSASSPCLSMKIFDWKRRTADESVLNDIENTVFTLDNLRSAPGARKRAMRKGRGIAAGKGATCGFGMRGQRSRSGNPQRPGFEGGQTPLYRRLPKFVGKPMGPGHMKTIYNIMPTSVLCNVEPGSVVTFNSLQELGLVTKSKFTLHKVVCGRHDENNNNTNVIASNIKVQAHAFTNTARMAIESVGGTCELLSKTTHQPITDNNDEGTTATASSGDDTTNVDSE